MNIVISGVNSVDEMQKLIRGQSEDLTSILTHDIGHSHLHTCIFGVRS